MKLKCRNWLTVFFVSALVLSGGFSNLIQPALAQPTVSTERVEIESDEVTKSEPYGTSMAQNFVKENEAASSGGMHIKTSKIGASVSYTFTGTGIRFLTKLGSGAGMLEVWLDGEKVGTIDQYVSGAPKFQATLYENLELGTENAEHTIKLVTTTGSQTNFNFDAFEVISTVEEEPLTISPGDTTYYLDSEAAADGNGLSEDTAFSTLEQVNSIQFAPGDKILIKRGTSYVGQLYPKGSGSAEKPIVLDVYGSGDKPIIDGQGRAGEAPAYGANGPFGQAGAVVYLHNQSHWSIGNLHLTNPGTENKERSGVRVEASGGGVYSDIHVHDMFIEHIRGFNGQSQSWEIRPTGGGATFYGSRVTHRTGGINFVSYTNRGPQNADHTDEGQMLDAEQTRFDNIVIENNVIENSAANGITTTNVKGSLDLRENRHTNVVIRNNRIHNVTRAGIVPLYTSGALVEGNVVDTFQSTYEGYGCGIWADRANGLVIQYNEVANGQNTMDGMAFNLDDMTEDSVIQYNYSHNNVGGGIMLHVRTNSYNRNNIVRHNLSVNDTHHYNAHQAIVVAVGEDANTKIEGARVYNNTFINHNKVHPVFKGHHVEYENNIFYLTNPGVAAEPNAYDYGPQTHFTNNLFGGVKPPSKLEAGNHHAYDPGFAGNLAGTEDKATALAKAALIESSLARNASGEITGIPASAPALGLNLWNHNLADGVPHIGAYQGPAAERTELPPTIEGEPVVNPELDGLRSEFIEAEDTRVAKHGNFTLVEGDLSQGHASTHVFTTDTDATLTLTFTGKAIELASKSGAGAGIAEIYLDGELVAVDDQYGNPAEFQRIVYTKVFDEPGEHTIEVKATGRANPSSSGTAFNFDYFRVYREADPHLTIPASAFGADASEDVRLNPGATLDQRLSLDADQPLSITGFDLPNDTTVTGPDGQSVGTVRITGDDAQIEITITQSALEGSSLADADGRPYADLDVLVKGTDLGSITIPVRVFGEAPTPEPGPDQGDEFTPTLAYVVNGAHLSSLEAHVGDTVNVLASGFGPFADVTLTLHSTPITIGTKEVDSEGEALFTFEVPDVEPGAHELVAKQGLPGGAPNGDDLVLTAKLALTVLEDTVDPDQPVDPKPDQPVNPDPDQPVNPDQPVDPDKPADPGTPGTPDKPADPGTPDKPSAPGGSGNRLPSTGANTGAFAALALAGVVIGIHLRKRATTLS